jgi:hypothetical protein
MSDEPSNSHQEWIEMNPARPDSDPAPRHLSGWKRRQPGHPGYRRHQIAVPERSTPDTANSARTFDLLFWDWLGTGLLINKPRAADQEEIKASFDDREAAAISDDQK